MQGSVKIPINYCSRYGTILKRKMIKKQIRFFLLILLRQHLEYLVFENKVRIVSLTDTISDLSYRTAIEQFFTSLDPI